MARLAVHVCIRTCTCTRPFYAARAAASRYIVRFVNSVCLSESDGQHGLNSAKELNKVLTQGFFRFHRVYTGGGAKKFLDVLST